MLLPEFIISLIAAIILSIPLSKVFMIARNQNNQVWIVIVLLLLTWSGGNWLRPFGPAFHDLYILPFFITGIVSAIVIAVSAHSQLPKNRHEALRLLLRTERHKKINNQASILLRFLLGAILLLLFLSIIAKHINT